MLITAKVGEIKGIMAFDRKDYGSGIPLVKIADRVEVTVDIKAKRVSGPPVDLKQSALYKVFREFKGR